MKYELVRAQYKARDGQYTAKLWFAGGEWHGWVKRGRKDLGGTLPGQTSSEFRTLTEQYLLRLIEKDKNTRKAN